MIGGSSGSSGVDLWYIFYAVDFDGQFKKVHIPKVNTTSDMNICARVAASVEWVI